MTDQVSNFVKVTVSTTYDASATSITLTTGHGSELPDPSGDNYNLPWWDSTNYPDPSDDPNVEIIRVTAKSSDTITVTRAQEGTSATTKNTSGATYKMILGPTAKTITDLQSEIDSDITTHAALGDAHHTESHTVASHSDTTVTGAELEELTDGSTTTLHDHAGITPPSDIAYDATSWDANTDSATKNAIRDKIETMDTAIGLNTAKTTNATHTGEVTGSGVLTIAVDAVTYDKMQDTSDTDKLLGRETAGAGTIEEIVCTAAGRAILDDADASAQRTTLGVDTAGTDNSTDVTLNASATTGGMSIATQEISNRAATNAQTGYMTAALVTNIETNNAKNTNVSTDVSAGTRTATTIDVNSSDGSNATLVEADTTNAGILGSDKWDEIVANTSKITNATHTGDVTGATALTIGAGKVLDSHINWGTGATQVSAVDLLIADVGVIITATEVEGALQENRTAIDLNTAKSTNISTALSVGTVGANTVSITSDGGADDVTLPASTNAAAGMATASQITKLEGIAAGADVTADNAPQTHSMATHTDEGALATLNTVDTAQVDDDSITYAKMQNVVADERILGNITAVDSPVAELTKAQVLNMLSVEDGATADQTGAEIKVAYEGEADTNEFSDAEKTKLGTVDTDADVTGSNAPQAHEASHKATGSDEILLDELGATTDVTTLDSSTSAHGLLKKLNNDNTYYMNGTGAWSIPPGGAAGTANILLPVEASYLPVTNPATLTEELGSTVYGGYSTADFDDTTAEHIVFRCPVPDYDGNNIIFKFYWIATATAGNVIWTIKSIGVTDGEEIVEAVVTDLVDVSADTVTGTTLDLNVTTHSTYNPASVAADDLMIIEITRKAGTDTMTGDARLIAVNLEYTRA